MPQGHFFIFLFFTITLPHLLSVVPFCGAITYIKINKLRTPFVELRHFGSTWEVPLCIIGLNPKPFVVFMIVRIIPLKKSSSFYFCNYPPPQWSKSLFSKVKVFQLILQQLVNDYGHHYTSSFHMLTTWLWCIFNTIPKLLGAVVWETRIQVHVPFSKLCSRVSLSVLNVKGGKSNRIPRPHTVQWSGSKLHLWFKSVRKADKS